MKISALEEISRHLEIKIHRHVNVTRNVQDLHQTVHYWCLTSESCRVCSESRGEGNGDKPRRLAHCPAKEALAHSRSVK